MKSNKDIIDIGIKTIVNEGDAILGLKEQIGSDFAKSVKRIFESSGRVIITGIGKSANIATKIVSTLNSTGTPAIFLHAADAIHGDLGIIQQNDVIICISNSGNTPEIKVLVPILKNRGNLLIAFTGNFQSYLASSCRLYH